MITIKNEWFNDFNINGRDYDNWKANHMTNYDEYEDNDIYERIKEYDKAICDARVNNKPIIQEYSFIGNGYEECKKCKYAKEIQEDPTLISGEIFEEVICNCKGDRCILETPLWEKDNNGKIHLIVDGHEEDVNKICYLTYDEREKYFRSI